MSVNNACDYTWTTEQNQIISAITNCTDSLIIVEAVAGSAKSSTITEAVKRTYELYPDLLAEYTVFGNANAREARAEFGHSCRAMTISSKAYQAVVKPYKLKLPITGYLTWRDLPKSLHLSYRSANLSIHHVEQFCTSRFTSLTDYSNHLEEPLTTPQYRAIQSILRALTNGKIRTTHAFYLKLYHILIMNGTIQLPELDILIADEAGDMTQISLDIFDMTPAKLKIVIGDSGQSVFGFMNLVSAFDFYSSQGTHLTLSRSFRVNSTDASLVESFCRDTFAPSMAFRGTDYTSNPVIRTSAYITRNNSTLVSEMIRLDSLGIPFRLSSTTKIAQLFMWPLALLYLKPGHTQRNPDLQHLQADADKWGVTPSLQKSFTLRSYILSQHENNQAIVSANRLLMQYSPSDVITAYKAAELHTTSSAPHVLMTAHTSKGLTLDSVTLADDLNQSVAKALLVTPDSRTQSDIETFKLYYIACTRHRYELHNAVHLHKYKES